MKNNLVFICFSSLFLSFTGFSQGIIKGKVVGLAKGDTATVRIQKSNEYFKFRILGGTGVDLPFQFDSLENGKWALSIDSKGYLFPVAKILEVNNNTLENIITLTKAPADSNFHYQWRDDSSYVGHAEQAYINEPVEVVVLGKAEKVPEEFNAINLLQEYGFLLSNDEGVWTGEEAYRLYVTLKRLNFPNVLGWRDSLFARAKWTITDQFIDRDISFTKNGEVDLIRISRAAFTYATPLVVTLDGVKGKFFSKRLFQSLVYYYTDKGTDAGRVAHLARDKYGFEFLTPGPLLREVMGETETNFQEFTFDEKLVILSMIEEFPDAMQKQPELKYMVRRINGQPHPICPACAALAHSNNIEFMELAFKDQNIQYMQRLVLHEKGHFLWAYTFDSTTKKDWIEVGGWFLDPTSQTGWSTYNTTEFVSAYAHGMNPNEDMAESIAWYITNPDGFRSRSIRKFEFIRDRIMNGSRYVSVIRPDLTFQVYNLNPDYYYPGKIIRTKVDVIGGANEDKKVIMEIELKTDGDPRKGAIHAAATLTSTIGTIIGVVMSPVNGNNNILRGSADVSKYAKSGYWIAYQIATYDEVWNARWENTSTYGFKCFINNPMEDVIAPLYVQGSLKMDTTSAKVVDLSGATAEEVCGSCADTLQPVPAIKFNIKVWDNKYFKPNGRVYFNINFPTIDSTDKYNIHPYSKEIDAINHMTQDEPDSIRSLNFIYPILDYYPSGYYAVPHLFTQDLAGNARHVFFDLDTANKSLFMGKNQRALRDSIYIKTKYPDYKAPMVDLNRIRIKATPTNPDAPNGETLFEMWLWMKDTSDFPDHAAGLKQGWYTLRNPQGMESSFTMQGPINYYGELIQDSSRYVYRQFYFKTLLPIGSPPGTWGVTSLNVVDNAGNRRYYSFTEFVRFDVEQSTELQVTPYVEILGKKVNASNVDSVSVKIGCKLCKEQNYRLRMYSSMGGNSVVVEGKMTADTIIVDHINLRGVNDGVLYATVFMLDSTNALIGTGKAIYTKDAQIPRSKQLKTNLNIYGKSNLDSLIVAIQTTEIVGTYNLTFSQSGVSSRQLNGTIGDSAFTLTSNLLQSFNDGPVQLKLIVYDTVGNPSEPVFSTIYKDTRDPVASLSRTTQSGLTYTFTLTVDEPASNSLAAADLIVLNGSIGSVTKTDPSHYSVVVTRSCNDQFALTVKRNAFRDSAGNGNNEISYSLNDTIVPLPPGVQGVTYCQFASAAPLAAAPSSGNALSWYGTNVTGGTATSAAPVPATVNSGQFTYYVSQRSTATGCESSRAAAVVTIKPAPAQPVITLAQDNSLVSSADQGNQWYKDDSVITGATAKTFKPVVTGNYSVKVTLDGCSSLSSANFIFSPTGLQELGQGRFIHLYPNPVTHTGLLNINWKLSVEVTRIRIDLFDASGRRVLSRSTGSHQVMVELPLNKGMYILEVSWGNRESRRFKVLRW